MLLYLVATPLLGSLYSRLGSPNAAQNRRIVSQSARSGAWGNVVNLLANQLLGVLDKTFQIASHLASFKLRCNYTACRWILRRNIRLGYISENVFRQ